ncbi:uncharacterized protein LOC124340613 [Daphnia pulicaria]|uniref:uncharacterized protein LOC124340613 n=1 Tax=Daphnia pulicaria TaxID=35523 RepID=UPI001EECB5FF|nr:uncharacterized protein LOC124340613 [Daphnia pulicaria]
MVYYDKINLQEAVTASSDITGPFISAVGEEAIIVAQQCGASRQQELEASKKKKEENRIKRMGHAYGRKKISQKTTNSSSGSFAVSPSPSKSISSGSSLVATSTSPFKASLCNTIEDTQGVKRKIFDRTESDIQDVVVISDLDEAYSEVSNELPPTPPPSRLSSLLAAQTVAIGKRTVTAPDPATGRKTFSASSDENVAASAALTPPAFAVRMRTATASGLVPDA